MTAMDDISVFLGAIPPDEYEARRRIRTCRNAAAFKATRTESANARDLCWMVTECATFWIYRPAPLDTLRKVVIYMAGLLKSADRVEQLEVLA